MDGIKALHDSQKIEGLALCVGGERLTYPVALSAGDRLIHRASGECIVRGTGGTPMFVQPSGRPPLLQPGRSPVRVEVAEDSPKEFKIRVLLCKSYE